MRTGHRTRRVNFRLLAEALGRCRTRWGGGRWKSQNRKNVYLPPYVEEPLNSKVLKSFVPEPRSRKCFSCFEIPMFYIYIYIYIYVMNIICTFHGYVTSTQANKKAKCFSYPNAYRHREMNWVTQVQILNEFLCIHMSRLFSFQLWTKEWNLTGFVNVGITTGLGEGKLWTEAFYFSLKNLHNIVSFLCGDASIHTHTHTNTHTHTHTHTHTYIYIYMYIYTRRPKESLDSIVKVVPDEICSFTLRMAQVYLLVFHGYPF